jgi:hypothetical protein
MKRHLALAVLIVVGCGQTPERAKPGYAFHVVEQSGGKITGEWFLQIKPVRDSSGAMKFRDGNGVEQSLTGYVTMVETPFPPPKGPFIRPEDNEYRPPPPGGAAGFVKSFKALLGL